MHDHASCIVRLLSCYQRQVESLGRVRKMTRVDKERGRRRETTKCPINIYRCNIAVKTTLAEPTCLILHRTISECFLRNAICERKFSELLFFHSYHRHSRNHFEVRLSESNYERCTRNTTETGCTVFVPSCHDVYETLTFQCYTSFRR